MKVAGLIISVFLFIPNLCIGTEFANHIDKSSTTFSEISSSTANPVCQSMIEHLENEIAETTASLKNCEEQSSDLSGKALADKTKEREQYKKKLELTKNNLSEVEEICAKGGTPNALPKAIIAKSSINVHTDNLDDNVQPEKNNPLLTGLTADLKNYSPKRTLSSNNPDILQVSPGYAGCWCCNGQFFSADSEKECFAKCCSKCEEHCAVAPPIVPPTEPPPTEPSTGTGFMEDVKTVLTYIWGGIATAAKTVWKGIATAAKAVWNGIKAFGNWIKETAIDLYHKIRGETEKCNGVWYNPDKECCKGKKVYSDKIKSLSDCPPPRYQKGQPDTSDYGCGKNGITKTILDEIGYVLEVNQSIDNPVGGKYTSFFSPCYSHDTDYATCNSSAQTDDEYRETADITFHTRMQFICNGDNIESGEKIPCIAVAKIYFGIVLKKGDPFYKSAQLENCKCCP